ncbi:unnamed protein product [Peniophora sp. CBMAI 1063]|nr:unnamed protein product [Peniophora sp. CBMAI 1063]
MPSFFHAQTDGASERTDKTLVQALRYRVGHLQDGWAAALPAVHFFIFNTVSASTGYAPFQLIFGRHPRTLPVTLDDDDAAAAQCAADFGSAETEDAAALIKCPNIESADARDDLIAAKADQAAPANKHRSSERTALSVGSRILSSTYHRRGEFVSVFADKNSAAKLFPCFDHRRPMHRHTRPTRYALDIPNAAANACLTFHSSLLKTCIGPDPDLAPDHIIERPGRLTNTEHQIRDVIVEQRRGRDYGVRWVGYGDTDVE